MSCPFEEFAEENGATFWRARWLMERLEYASWASFRKVLNKATASCVRVGCDIAENFRSAKVISGGREEEDFKLTRFACFLVAQHADPRKASVEQVRTYLAGLAAVMVDGQMLERLEERDTLTAGEKTMTAAATRAGVDSDSMAVFKDAGFRGMYNMSRKRLASHKGLAPDKILYDYMGIEELAANSFRVTQTAARLKATGIRGSHVAQQVAREVGADVRAMMINNSGGQTPESIPLDEDIKQVRKAIKTTSRAFLKKDSKPIAKAGRKKLASPS
jgi:DNA-damage-inducible protein D